ncbi:MAG: D-alanyl-D-alanine carboxypeptidase, partial [Clostridia bacterium]|nr:D-alanyl-D-alanine carboxypeptidase [Clostridia bacterium]
MTLYRKAFAAWIAAVIFIFTIAALAEATAQYDMNAPQNLLPEHLYAQSALLIDEDTGEMLFAKNARVRMYPASTTKIMTLLLGIESGIPLDERITIPAEAADIPQGSSVIPVKPGDVMSYGDLLYSFMLSSGNDGANAVAVLVDGSIEAFVQRMNDRAAALGMEGTHYVNAHGYHVGDHYTTAQDLAILARAAMENDTFRHIVAQPSWTITVTRDGETRTAEIVSRNSLLQSDQKYYYPDCTGIKTGHHNKAGWCFVGSAERDGMRVICVVLNCEQENDKWYDAAKLFEYGFTRYSDVSVRTLLERASERFAEVEIDNAAGDDGHLPLSLAGIAGGEQTLKVVSDSETALARAVERFADNIEVRWTRPL